MSYKLQTVKNTVKSREELEKQKTMYNCFYDLLNIEEQINQAAAKGEGLLILTGNDSYFHHDGLKNTFKILPLESPISVQSVLNDLRFVEFLQNHEKLQDFDIYRAFMGDTVIKWMDI